MDINKILASIGDIPALPDMAARVIAVTDNPKSSSKDLALVIAADQALAAKVLKLANSAYYGYNRRIATITEAIVILGINEVRTMAAMAQVYKFLDRDLDGYGLAAGELWLHSLASAIAARHIANYLQMRRIDEIYLAALLHDIGKILLSQYLKDHTDAVKEAQAAGIPLFIAERKVFVGIDHALVGARVCEKWGMPQQISESIYYHHSPQDIDDAQNPDFCNVIYLAHTLATNLDLKEGITAPPSYISIMAMNRAGINEGSLKAMIPAINENFLQLSALL